jgi:mono/diheme cytochrome c family protein
LLGGCNQPYVPSAWRTQVPAATRALLNPLPPSALNIADGSQSYQLYCSGCHGTDGTGRRGRPALDTARVHGETDGEIYWILHNGSKGHGMPAWRSLGDQDLWQLVVYLRTLATPASSARSGN